MKLNDLLFRVSLGSQEIRFAVGLAFRYLPSSEAARYNIHHFHYHRRELCSYTPDKLKK